MTLGRKIGLGYLAAVVLIVILTAITYRTVGSLTAALDEQTEATEALRHLEGLNGSLLAIQSGGRGYVLTGSEEFLAAHRIGAAELEVHLAALRQRSDQAGAAELDQIERRIRAAVAAIDEYIAVRRAQGFEPATALIRSTRPKQLADEAKEAIATLKRADERVRTALQAQATDQAGDARMVTVALAVMAAIGLALLGWVIIRSIGRAIRALIEGAEKMAVGQLDHRIAVDAGDETATLAMRFNEASKQRGEAAEAVAVVARDLAAASAELLGGVAQQTSGAQEQAAAVAQTASTVTQLSQTAQHTADDAKQVAGRADQSEVVWRQGRESVEAALGQMTQARQRTEALAQGVLALAAQSQQVGEVITMIDDLADQTNILALNAAIEAARAGDAGRAFAVVATEVKALADQSKEATVSVRRILGDIQKLTNNAVLAAEDGTRAVGQAVTAATEAGATITALAETIGSLAEAAARIAAQSEQQAQGLSQIHGAMRDIHTVTNQGLAATRQAERLASDLSALGRKLQAQLER